MLAETCPLRVLLLTVSGVVNRHRADVIAYLVEENRVLKERLKGRALRLFPTSFGGVRSQRIVPRALEPARDRALVFARVVETE